MTLGVLLGEGAGEGERAKRIDLDARMEFRGP